MTKPVHLLASVWISLLLILVLPLAGAAAAGRSLRPLLRFPPSLEILSDYVHFSWLAGGGVIGALAVLVVSWAVGARRRPQHRSAHAGPRARTSVPVWGWFALVWTLVWWAIAWTRSPYFEYVQLYTFFPLWCGFVVTINAYTQSRTGTCLLTRSPTNLLLLAAESAAFWWLFEWLNRFVGNWHYLGVSDFGPLAYAVHATVCFSTVLPAVASVAEALRVHRPSFGFSCDGPRWRWFDRRPTGITLVLCGAAALALTGFFPHYFYPALWVAPLALSLGQSIFSGRPSFAHEVARGEWSRVLRWMAAALVCGFFWELWNWQSLAKWIYTVPGVDRWHVFEMPLLGYSGYLPFGLECLLVSDWLLAERGASESKKPEVTERLV